MKLTILPYIDETSLTKAKTMNSSNLESSNTANASGTDAVSDSIVSTAADTPASFEETLALAQQTIVENAEASAVPDRTAQLLSVDAAIALAKQAGDLGIRLNSSTAIELGITNYSPSMPAKTVTNSSGETENANNTHTYGYSASSSEGNSALSCPDELEGYFEEAAKTYNVDAKLLKSIAKTESNFHSDAVSHAGAVGIMQLMPSTAQSLGVQDSYNAHDNIMGGAKLISQLLNKYDGDLSLALAAYNAGSGAVDRYGGIPPYEETQNYVVKVTGFYCSET